MGWRDRSEWYMARNAALARDGNQCCGIVDGDRCEKLNEPAACMSREERIRARSLPTRLHVHHIVPVADGGATHDLDNLVSLCHQCHGAVEAGHRDFLRVTLSRTSSRVTHSEVTPTEVEVEVEVEVEKNHLLSPHDHVPQCARAHRARWGLG